MRHRTIWLTLLALLATLRVNCQSDSIITSLVTCSPGTLVYEVYGHTAVRVQNFTKGSDLVFNYGLFDFNSPHFAWRWTKGETDYFVGAIPWRIFEAEYMERGSTIWLQELNMDSEGHLRLARLLEENCMPENRIYRYNFLYNNCATLALDKIEEAVDGHVIWYIPDKDLTFRKLLHEYNGCDPWNSFAVDLVTGAETDLPINARQASFAPMRLMELVENATVTDTAGIVRPLVKGCSELPPPVPAAFRDCLISPTQAVILFGLLTILFCLIEWCLKKPLWVYDVLVFGLQGLMGSVIAFLYFFSSHPTTDSNWLLICLNPIPLLCLPFMVYNITHRRLDVFLIFNFFILTAFIIFSSRIPQYLSTASILLLAVFALRSLSDLLLLIHNGAGFSGSRSLKLTVVLSLLMYEPQLCAQTGKNNTSPKLIVGIVIDQMDGDYLEQLMPLFGNDGFKKLWSEGYNMTDASFEYDCNDRASAVASLYTGTVPFYHGIIGEQWMERKSMMPVNAVDDSYESGINTIDHSSPKRLQVLSVADMMKISYQGKSLICSVAAERDAAILAGGHEADAVLWMNDTDGQWSSSGYYGSFPFWANEINNQEWHRGEWKPTFPPNSYIKTRQDVSFSSFSHTFSRGEIWSSKTSPVVNDQVAQMALLSFDDMELGNADAPDLLAVTLYAGGFNHQSAGLESLELQDIYVRLDQNIADIIRHVEKKIGKDNVLFFLTSTGYKEVRTPDISGTRMPTGTVSMERITALLNLYLSAIYGQGNIVSTYYDTHLYLDRNIISDKDLSIQKISDSCADFLLQVTGVKSVITQRDLLSGNLSAETLLRRNSLNTDCSGDIIIEVAPGWTVIDDKRNTSYLVKRQKCTFPVILYGAGVRSEINHQPVSASVLAPTLTWMLGIPAPHACNTLPLTNIR